MISAKRPPAVFFAPHAAIDEKQPTLLMQWLLKIVRVSLPEEI